MLACSASAGAVLLKVRGRPYLPAILIVAALVGAARGVAFDPDGAAPLSEYHSIEDISVAGWVADDPEPAGRAVRFRFRVEEVSGSIEGGDLLVTMASADVRYGDRLLLSGVLEDPPGVRGLRLRSVPRTAWNRLGDVVPRRADARRQGRVPALQGADRAEAQTRGIHGAGRAGAAGGVRPGSPAWDTGPPASQAGRRLQGYRSLPPVGHIWAARRHPARAEPDREPVAAGTPQEPVPVGAVAAALAVRRRRRNVAIGDAGGDNGQRLRRRHGVGTAPRHTAVAGASSRGDGGIRPQGALERLVPPQLRRHGRDRGLLRSPWGGC